MSKVLFIDDEFQVLEGLRRVFSRQKPDWDLDFVTSGEHALQKINLNPPDVVVTDIRMSGLQGDELLEQIRSRFPGIGAVALSGYCNEQIEQRIGELGAPLLSKPALPSVLIQAIENQISITQNTVINETSFVFGNSVNLEVLLLQIIQSIVAAGLIDSSSLPAAVLERLAPEVALLNFYDDEPAAAFAQPLPIPETVVYPVFDGSNRPPSNGWVEEIDKFFT